MIKITLYAYENERKIPAIKSVRTLTGMGLKEAKAIVDALPKNKQFIEVTDYNEHQVRQILNEGFLSYDLNINDIEKHIRSAMSQAASLGKYDTVLHLIEAVQCI